MLQLSGELARVTLGQRLQETFQHPSQAGELRRVYLTHASSMHAHGYGLDPPRPNALNAELLAVDEVMCPYKCLRTGLNCNSIPV